MSAGLGLPQLSSSQANELAVAASVDSAARESLTHHCMGLIVSLSERFRGSLGEDAMGEASIAFLEAIDDYDIALGDFRSWAVGKMWLRLIYKARQESFHSQRFPLRANAAEGLIAEAEVRTLPRAIRSAYENGALTDRQMQILAKNIAGYDCSEICEAIGISLRTYHRDMAKAIVALRIHAE